MKYIFILLLFGCQAKQDCPKLEEIKISHVEFIDTNIVYKHERTVLFKNGLIMSREDYEGYDY